MLLKAEYGLQYLITQKISRIRFLLYHVNGCNPTFLRHLLYFNFKYINRFREQAYEYELLVSKTEDLEKDKDYFQQKFQSASSELLTMKGVRDKNEKLEANVSQLNKTIEELESREQKILHELNRLRNCEAELKSSNEKSNLKEQKILELLSQNRELDSLRMSANDQLKKVKAEYEEILEQLTGENAMYQNQKSSLEAQLINLKEEHNLHVKTLLEEVSKKKVLK